MLRSAPEYRETKGCK